MKPDFAKTGGLVPVIAQDASDGTVLMMAYMNEEAYQKTLETKEVHYWSRSRNKLWHKGGTSGHVQKLKSLRVDCDADTILVLVEQIGNAACHEGYRSCFFREIDGDKVNTVSEKVFDPKEVYK